ncbi:MAG: dihydrofolate reductase [Bacteroidales bacterium]|nr:dihydrofolate reductase [Bacteroidales bacterium]
MPNISIIVAIADNNAIGKNNQLLWHISDDMKYFKSLTLGNPVVMGKKTYDSLPVKPLPQRLNIVISDDETDYCEGCAMAYSIEEAMKKCNPKKENFIIGGGSIYRQFLPYAQKLYITRIHKSFDADTYFPDINMEEWEEIDTRPGPPDEKNDFTYSYHVYKRK